MKAAHAPAPPEIRGYLPGQTGIYYTHANTLGRSAVIGEHLRLESEILRDDVQQGIDWHDTYQAPGKKFHLDASQRAYAKRCSAEALQDMATSYEDMAESYSADIEAGLRQARSFFLTMDPGQSQRAEQVLEDMGINNSIFGNWKQKIDPRNELSWGQTLGQRFTDDQLLNFLQANVSETALAQAELDEQLPKQLRHYKTRVHRAVHDGWLPESALDSLDKIDNIHFFAGDLFDTISRGIGGYFCPTDNLDGVVVIAAEALLSNAKMVTVLTHEMTHAIAGSNGAKHGLRFNNSNIWLDEAMTEHITQSLLGRKIFEDPYPYQDTQGKPIARGSYMEERNLLTVLQEVLPMDELAGMYFDPDHVPLVNTLAVMVSLVGADTYKRQMATYNTATERAQQKTAMKSLAILAGKAIVRSRVIGASFTDSNQI